ncbi:hypothetical protein E2C01_020193 [Portunus trituberculatus]|uniref:Uncharacterized protein n=1 Tax=Portunus trituberculatus TaxID=210409 RepID=A0A5B7DZA9_PORTR|nr:hypothetical protein [Portunus trituberculatus]
MSIRSSQTMSTKPSEAPFLLNKDAHQAESLHEQPSHINAQLVIERIVWKRGRYDKKTSMCLGRRENSVGTGEEERGSCEHRPQCRHGGAREWEFRACQ